jgi:NADH-quinone oxidoreductase subunit C
MTFDELKSIVQSEFPDRILGEDLNANPKALIVDHNSIKALCLWLRDNESTYFDSLSCLSGIDHGPEENRMEVVYHLYSIPFDLHLSLKTIIDRTFPIIDSVTDVWKTANWHEREAYDLLGIQFNDHPDLRRILLPNDWEGHPLRQDYQEQEKYHGIVVKYDEERIEK